MSGADHGPSGYAPDADASSVRRLFSRIAGGYDLLNSLLSFGIDARWRSRLAEAARPFPGDGNAPLLDLAAGTLEVSLALARRYPERGVLAMDFCRPMLLRGLPKLAGAAPGRILPVTADARRIPLPDGCVAAVTMAFGLRNIRPREEAYAEALRVLAPGGALCVLEFGSASDRILLGAYNLYLKHVLPRVARMFSRDESAYKYLVETVLQYPGAEELALEMRAAGFTGVAYRKYTAGIVVLHAGVKPA